MAGKDGADGKIQIMDDAVMMIAGMAAMEVPGMADLNTSMADEIVEKLGRKSSGKGVKVKRSEEGLFLDLYVIMDFGVCIPEVALEVQRSVKSAIEKLTGFSVLEINVTVQGIRYHKAEEDKEAVK
jgi:Uncharacterized protein conserved in bacteria